MIIINISFTGKKISEATEDSSEIVSVNNEMDDIDNEIDKDKKAVIEQKKETVKQLLDIEALKDTWIKVFSDGNQIFEGVLLSGQQQTCYANNDFTIRIGNVENLKLSFNGKPIDINVGAKEDKTNTLTFKKDI